MAKITKVRGRKPVAEGMASAGASWYPADGGLTFRIGIGPYMVVLSHVERDRIIEAWAKAQQDMEA